MINLVTYNNNWTQAVNVVVDIFMKCMDWMFTLTLPGTDIPLYTLWIISAVLGLVGMLLRADLRLSHFSQYAKSAVASGYESAFNGIVKLHDKNSHTRNSKINRKSLGDMKGESSHISGRNNNSSGLASFKDKYGID